MTKRCLFTLLLLLLIPAILHAQQSGKIVGTIIDSGTGEPIPGVNVMIAHSSLGATTDLDGYFIILNVSVGLNTVHAQYIGYRDVFLNDVRVFANTTSNIKIKLEPATLELTEAIEIIAERPLVEKNFTHSYSVLTADQIENIAVRGLDEILALQPGVVVQNGNVYIRGGRSDQTGYYLDGASITSPYDNTRYFSVIQNAVEELQVLTGGYQAEYGGAISGIVLTELKTGKPDLNLSLEMQTDNFVDNGEKFLDTYSYGHSIITGTVSLPLFTPSIRLFAAIENEYIADWRKRWSTGFEVSGLVDSERDSKTYQDTIDIKYPDGFTPKNSQNNWRINSTILIDLNKYQIRLKGIYNNSKTEDNLRPIWHLLNSRSGWYNETQWLGE